MSTIMFSACTRSEFPTERGTGVAVDTVVAVVQDLTPVLTVDAVVSANEQVDLIAPISGTLTHVTGTEPESDTIVRDGQVVGSVDGQNVLAVTNGKLLTWLAPDGATVPSGLPVARIVSSAFTVRAALPLEASYRVVEGPTTVKAQIVSGPGPFDCSPVTFPASANQEAASSGSVSFGCVVPNDISVFAGLPAILALRSGTRLGVVTLPLTAVAGRLDVGQVTVIAADGNQILTDVDLGVTDGVNIEITGGLSAGTNVASSPPNLTIRPLE